MAVSWQFHGTSWYLKATDVTSWHSEEPDGTTWHRMASHSRRRISLNFVGLRNNKFIIMGLDGASWYLRPLHGT